MLTECTQPDRALRNATTTRRQMRDALRGGHLNANDSGAVTYTTCRIGGPYLVHAGVWVGSVRGLTDLPHQGALSAAVALEPRRFFVKLVFTGPFRSVHLFIRSHTLRVLAERAAVAVAAVNQLSMELRSVVLWVHVVSLISVFTIFAALWAHARGRRQSPGVG